MTEKIEEVRKLASVRRIAKIEPIEGADKIVMATVDGWKLVTAIDNGFKEGDLVIYFEIDSWIPHEIAPFLSKGKEPRVFEGVEGERLRTIKLRGQVSQGLIMPLDILARPALGDPFEIEEGLDLTEYLGIIKYEKPIPANLGGQVKRYFPSFIKKTDQERAQNIVKDIFLDKNQEYEVSIKMDGSSMTVYSNITSHIDDSEQGHHNLSYDIEVGVCSRNLELKLDQEGNSFVDFAKNSKILEALKKEKSGRSVAIQGELMGEGIQGNREFLASHHLFVYDIWDINEQKYFSSEDRIEFFETYLKGLENVHLVPILHSKASLNDLSINGIEDLLEFAEGESFKHAIREGVVFKSTCGKFSFKVISNKFLTKEK